MTTGITIEKAIEILQISKDIVEKAGAILDCKLSADGEEAFDMAITALRERNLPYEVFDNPVIEPMEKEEVERILDNARDAVRKRELNKGWIPVSERLPEDLEEVNVTWINHDPEPYYAFVKDKPATGSAVYYKGEWYWYSSVCSDILAEYGKNNTDMVDTAIEITAWMPLPEPFRKESV